MYGIKYQLHDVPVRWHASITDAIDDLTACLRSQLEGRGQRDHQGIILVEGDRNEWGPVTTETRALLDAMRA